VLGSSASNLVTTNVYAGADPGFVGPEAYTILGALFREKNTKLRKKVNII
jgi:hypothetical protein